MTDLEIFYKRRSIRKYLDTPIEDYLIENILSAAMAAPSAMNFQPWRFIVVKDTEKLKKIRQALFFGKINAPCAISVCGSIASIGKYGADKFWVQDCSAATENILLAVSALGLGGVWCGVHSIYKYEKEISSIMELPEGVKPLNIIFVGYPAETKSPRSQYDPQKIYRDTFGNRWIDIIK